MSGKDDQAETNGTIPVLDEHQDIRRRFVKLWSERACGDPGEPSLAVAWQSLANLLENHLTAKERHVESF